MEPTEETAAPELEPTGLERFSQATEDDLAEALERGGTAFADRFDEAPEAEPEPSSDVAQKWAEALEDDPFLASVVDANPDAFGAWQPSTPEEIAQVKELTAKQEYEANLAENIHELRVADAVEDAREQLYLTDDDSGVVALLNELSEKIGLQDPRLAEFLEEAEDIAPEAAMAWVSMAAQAQAEAIAAAEAKLEDQERQRNLDILAKLTGLIGEKKKAEPRFNESISPKLEVLLGALPNPESPDEASERLEQAYAAAAELDRCERVDSFLDTFTERTNNSLLDTEREAIAKEVSNFGPTQPNAGVVDSVAVSRAERLNAFAELLGERFSDGSLYGW